MSGREEAISCRSLEVKIQPAVGDDVPETHNYLTAANTVFPDSKFWHRILPYKSAYKPRGRWCVCVSWVGGVQTNKYSNKQQQYSKQCFQTTNRTELTVQSVDEDDLVVVVVKESVACCVKVCLCDAAPVVLIVEVLCDEDRSVLFLHGAFHAHSEGVRNLGTGFPCNVCIGVTMSTAKRCDMSLNQLGT